MMRLTDLGVIKSIFEKYDFNFSKGLGQNFLINPTVCPKIAEMGNAKKGFGVIEVGTGIGVLTAELASRADKVVAVEIDKRLMPVLDETLADFDNVKILNQDILETDLNKLIETEFEGLEVAFCANLPYYITSPVIMSVLESRADIKTLTVMVQKEAGDRLCAKVGTRECGAVTVAVNYYGEARKLFDVSRGSFVPSPKVDSCVIQIETKQKYNLTDEQEKMFFRIVKAGFSQRRKTFTNPLSQVLGIPKAEIGDILEQTGLKRTARIEEIEMDKLIELAKIFSSI